MGVPRCFHKFTKPYSQWVPFGTLKIKKWVRFTEVHKNYREISTITTVTKYDSITNDDRPRQRVSGNSGIERSQNIKKVFPSQIMRGETTKGCSRAMSRSGRRLPGPNLKRTGSLSVTHPEKSRLRISQAVSANPRPANYFFLLRR